MSEDSWDSIKDMLDPARQIPADSVRATSINTVLIRRSDVPSKP